MSKLMRTLIAIALIAIGLAVPANAELAKGTLAPLFSTQTALAGKEMGFSLRLALKRGPVVLYF
jgi:hypothetical protein